MSNYTQEKLELPIIPSTHNKLGPFLRELKELGIVFNLSEKLKEVKSEIDYELEEVICLKYGGRQFGTYSDLGDKRVVLVEERGVKGVTIIKGGFTTPLCDYGNGHYKNALKEKTISTRLQEEGVYTQRVLKTIERTKGHTSVIWRPSPFRFGTIEYVYLYCRHLMPHIWNLTKTHAGDPDMSDQELWRLIEGGYNDLCDMWEAIGFTHGCLNTDNLCLLPCGIDYGHSYFIDEEEHDLQFDPHQVYGHHRQREIIKNNLQALKEVLTKTLYTSL